MVRGWTRRQRLILRSALLGGIAVLAVAGTVLLRSTPAQYKPGERMEGLTEELARSIPAQYRPVQFTEVASQVGIDFRHFHGERSRQLPEDMGSGAAWGDYDRDGDLDLYVVNEAGPLSLTPAEVAASPAHSALYRNEGNGSFAEVSGPAGVDLRGCGQGTAWGDYDNDGYPDLVATSYGVNALFHNERNGRFAEVSRRAGIGGVRGFWSGASWGDYDRDGDLDLYICGYVQFRLDPTLAGQQTQQYTALIPASLNPSTFAPEHNLLYRNNGDGTFAEVAKAAGVDNPTGRSLSASWADFDADGRLDLYVANDVSDNAMFRNRGDGRFDDISHRAWVADYRGAMGLAVGDWDADGDQDIFITHWIAQENALYDNLQADFAEAGQKGLRFMDVADRVGLGQIALDYVGWGTAFLDFDLDGRLDLLAVNGSTFQREDDPSLLVPMKDLLFWNGGQQEGFFEVGAASGPVFAREKVGRGLAVGDYDNDGDPDALVVVNGGPAVLLRNEGNRDRHWLKVRLKGRQSNRDGLGAQVRVVAGDRVQRRQVGSTSSYLSQHALGEELFGLGPEPRVDTLEVAWLGGAVQVLTGLTADQTVEVVEGQPLSSAASVQDGAGSAATPIGDRVPGKQAQAALITADRKAQIRRFWEVYSQATELRIKGDWAVAVAALQEALTLDPRHEDSLYYLGNALFELGRYSEAIETWHELTALNPTQSSRVHAQLGMLYSCATPGAPFDLGVAEQELHQALAINKEESGPILKLGEIALLKGEDKQAREYLSAGRNLNFKSVAAGYLIGYLKWAEGDHQGALKEMRQAVEYTRSAKPPPEASGEGDTKKKGPMLARGAGERGLLTPHWRSLEEWPAGPVAPARMQEEYQRFDRALKEMQQKIREGRLARGGRPG